MKTAKKRKEAGTKKKTDVEKVRDVIAEAKEWRRHRMEKCTQSIIDEANENDGAVKPWTCGYMGYQMERAGEAMDVLENLEEAIAIALGEKERIIESDDLLDWLKSD